MRKWNRFPEMKENVLVCNQHGKASLEGVKDAEGNFLPSAGERYYQSPQCALCNRNRAKRNRQ